MSFTEKPSVGPASPFVADLPQPVTDSRSGDKLVQWFSEEVYPHEGQLRGYLRRRYPRVHDVDDVVQESFLRIWKARLARPILSAKTFLFQIARHLVVDKVRRERAGRTESIEDLTLLKVMDDRPDPYELLGYHEKVAIVAGALAELPERCREVFILRKFKGVPQREIAFKLRIAEGTVESQLARGMKLMERH
ncbi:MAG TPA: RNA polymerase sigma factor, partial [Opitutaceae bacterium]|nr:RNA polymerase sigma factor [Opitutaceae bacterium]